jgi:GntR family transcriptional regulator
MRLRPTPCDLAQRAGATNRHDGVLSRKIESRRKELLAQASRLRAMNRPTRSRGGRANVPPSRRIANELRRAILSGETPPGSRLPSERALAEVHGTARNTARQAIAILQAEGLVEAEHGRGVFVREKRPLLLVTNDRFSRRHREAGVAPFRAEVEAQGRTARVELLAIERQPAPEWIAAELGLDPGEAVLARHNRYLADDEPMQLVSTYLPLSIAAGTKLEREVSAPGGIYAALEQLGHRLSRVDERITARMPLPSEVDALALSAGVPVIELRHTGRDTRGQAIEVTLSVLPADRTALTFQFPVE